MSDTKTFKVQEMPGGFWILENGKCVAKRKTFNDTAACALRLDYMARENIKPGKAEKRNTHHRERRAGWREIREAL